MDNYMIIEVSVAVIAVAFAILVYFLIRTLLSLQKTLKDVDNTVIEVEKKLKSFDSTLHTISNIGDLGEKESEKLKRSYLNHGVSGKEDSLVDEVADWVTLSLKLGNHFLNRR